ncbi:hypothetical protein SNA_31985 [Streptomyces natalensis ATCC 27448]|uniref:Uncharacterized protein n=1 Tax=Streptomyces natalensis ATCC 27448 TaxID=1240678 RepID=A0A0D7CH39_9ACTN|nr:hypothetical protein SNA_31985 [Streptomyces natalensis ATCC 27448]
MLHPAVSDGLGFEDRRQGAGRQHLPETEAGAGEQVLELGGGALASLEGHRHDEVECGGRVRCAVAGRDRVDQEEPGGGPAWPPYGRGRSPVLGRSERLLALSCAGLATAGRRA